jgi:hypothetical protein
LASSKKPRLHCWRRAIRLHRDLAERLDLLASVDGIGVKTAVVTVLVKFAGGRKPVRWGGRGKTASIAPSQSAAHAMYHDCGPQERNTRSC